MGSMVLAKNGILYGTTAQNGNNHTSGGALFSFDPSKNLQQRLYGFENGGDGNYPNGTLVQAPDGKLYGMTQVGGTGQNYYGVLFSYDIANSAFTKEQDFNNINGAFPGVSSALMVYKSGQPNIPPKIEITDPLNNKQYSAGTSLTFKAKAIDSDGSVSKVEFYLGKVKVGEDNNAPYEITKKGMEPGSYQLTAVATDDIGASTTADTIRFIVTACIPKGNISVEWFKNIPGSATEDLINNPAYPSRPDKIGLLSNFEYSNQGDKYGARVRGFICAPQSGNYIFYISGDDDAQLFLSTDENPVNKVLIAKTDKNKSLNGWFKSSGQNSLPIALVKGGRYYIETLHKQNKGANHLAVAWKLPGGSFEAPIARNRLSPFLNVKSLSVSQEAYVGLKLEGVGDKGLLMDFDIKISPNPSTQYFNLIIKSGSKERITYMVTDISGRIIEQGNDLMPNSTKELGRNLIPGVYILQVVQGKEHRVIKMVKQ